MFGSELTGQTSYLFLVLLVGLLESLSRTADLLLSYFATDLSNFCRLVADVPARQKWRVENFFSFGFLRRKQFWLSLKVVEDFDFVTSCFVCLLHAFFPSGEFAIAMFSSRCLLRLSFLLHRVGDLGVTLG